MVELRLPNITGLSEKEQLSQIKSYLYQLTGQLQWALTNLETTTQTAIINTQNSASKSAEKVDAESTFNSVKALIIKSAEIVEAYYEEMNKTFSGEYVAQSDFGTFSERTEQSITENSTEIERAFTNIQEIVSNVESITYSLIEVNAHIKTGLLYYDSNGVPVYGLEIGQRTIVDEVEVFNKYARFTADRLSFYDQNNNEVAYISDYKLYIRNVEITSSYKIGGFVDTVMSNLDVVEKWVGGEG